MQQSHGPGVAYYMAARMRSWPKPKPLPLAEAASLQQTRTARNAEKPEMPCFLSRGAQVWVRPGATLYVAYAFGGRKTFPNGDIFVLETYGPVEPACLLRAEDGRNFWARTDDVEEFSPVDLLARCRGAE